MGYWDELSKQIADEDRTVLAKYPHIQTAVDALANEKTTLQTKYQEADSKYKETDRFVSAWESWKTTNWDKWPVYAAREDGSEIRVHPEVQVELTSLQEQVQAAQGKQGADMDWNDLQKQIDGAGYMTGEKFNKEFAPVIETKVNQHISTELGKHSANLQTVFARTSPYMVHYSQEFGAAIDMEAFLKHLGDRNLWDSPEKIKAGFDEFVAPQRAKINEEKHKLELVEAEDRGRKAALQERTQSADGNFPVDQNGSAPEQGHLAARQLARTAAAKTSEPDHSAIGGLGTGGPSAAMYQQYLKDQAAKQAVN